MEQIHILVKRIENLKLVTSTLQKNTHLTGLASFNKSLFKLIEHVTELEKLMVNLNQPVEPVFAKKDFQKQSLIFQYKHLIGILNLIYGNPPKKLKKIQLSDKKLEKVDDKQLLGIVQNTIVFTKKISGLLPDIAEKKSLKSLAAKMEKAKKLSEEYGLTDDKVQKLENAGILFTKTMIEAELASKEQAKTIKRIKKLLELTDHILKNKTDKFVEVYEKPESNFVKTYQSLRTSEEQDKKEKLKKKKDENILI
jgi:hypothetical protein